MSDKGCPHMSSCEMYDIFTYAGTLGAWKINYCTADHTRCARFELARSGKPVPINLMPNGKRLSQSSIKPRAGHEDDPGTKASGE